MTEETLRAFGRTIQRLVARENLTQTEAESAFRQILQNEQPDLHQGAFLAALVAKGETAAEIAGAWKAIDELDTVHAEGPFVSPLVDNCGTGMDTFKTFNVSTAASIIAAACGVPMARHGARALTSRFGTVDLAEALGVDVGCDAEVVARSIRCAGIGLFNGMSPRIHPAALGRILGQIRFGSSLNIAASLANPARPAIGVRGVYAEAKLGIVAEVMRAIGYTRGMVVHGRTATHGGMDELSVCGESLVHEFFPDGRTATYNLHPAEVGLRCISPRAIAPAATLEEERNRFLRVLAGQGDEGCRDFACLNAAAVLYTAGRAADLREGVAQSRCALESGSALRKLSAWVAAQNTAPDAGRQRLAAARQAAGLSPED
jgi:anthranilate phosphoribosyltransferase